MSKCFACDKHMKPLALQGAFAVAVRGEGTDHLYSVGPDCYKKILATKGEGYKPAKGGPVLIGPGFEKAPPAMPEYAFKKN